VAIGSSNASHCLRIEPLGYRVHVDVRAIGVAGGSAYQAKQIWAPLSQRCRRNTRYIPPTVGGCLANENHTPGGSGGSIVLLVH
jgi:hypothetical protein